MTMPHERTRAVIETGEFLRRIARDESLSATIRAEATALLRHYPSRREVLLAGQIERDAPSGPMFDSTDSVQAL